MKQTFKNHMIMLAALLTLLAGPLLARPAYAAGAALAVAVEDPSIYYGTGSSTDVHATLSLDGQPVSGETVRFALISGAGTLSAAEATTDSAGQAQVSFTAPATLDAGRVVVIQASYTAPDQTTTTDSATIFLGSARELSAITTVETQAGRQLIRPVGMNLDVVKDGTGTPIISLGTFEGDPFQTSCKAEPGPPELGPAISCTRRAAASFKPKTAFHILHLSSTQGVERLEVRLRYRVDRNERGLRLFWHGARGWHVVRGATVHPNVNEVRFVFTATSTPSLSQLASGQFGLVVGR